MKVLFEISEKFRSGILEKVGYVLCTPFCIIVLTWILNDLKFTDTIIRGLYIAVPLFVLGYMSINQAYDAMYKLDLKIRRTYSDY